jgi:diguanylate cyclase
MDTVLVGNNAEIFCGIIIDTLKELRSNFETVTPNILHQALSKKQEYLKMFTDRGFATSSESKEDIQEDRPVHNGNDPVSEYYVKQLRDFRLNLFSEFEDKLPEEFVTRSSEILEIISKSNNVEQILNFNDEVLDILRAATHRVSGELEEFTSLAKEIGKGLIEMETDLISSFSCTRETFENNKAFNNTLGQNLGDIFDTINLSKNLIELKGFVASKLSTIKDVLEKKRGYDNLQLKKATEQVKKLRQRIRGMKQEIVQVQKKAGVLEQEVLLDPLTGVHNRRAYARRIQEDFARFERQEGIFSVLMIDIDHFKSVNDRYGHWAGDKCLEGLAKLIKKILRGTDFLARYGGEEFIAILPGTDEQGTHIVAQRMCQLIARTRFLCQDEEIPLTVSIGGTAAKLSDLGTEAIFKRVDMAMYEAKRTGRNRSIIF